MAQPPEGAERPDSGQARHCFNSFYKRLTDRQQLLAVDDVMVRTVGSSRK